MNAQTTIPRARLNEVEQLRAYSRVAQAYETILEDVAAVLFAVHAGGLLDAAPASEEDRDSHSAATTLLYDLDIRVRNARQTIEDTPGTGLHIYLDVRADNAEKAR